MSEIEIPFGRTVKISQRIKSLHNCFLQNNFSKAISLMRVYREDKNILHKDLKAFHQMCFLSSYEKFKTFFLALHFIKKDLNTLALLQITSHRIYEREGFTRELSDIIGYTIDSSHELKSHKWRISGYFFLGFYSGKRRRKFRCFMKCLDPRFIEVDMDLWRDKIVYVINWLRYYYPEKSKKKVEKIHQYLQLKGETYSEEILPLVKDLNFEEIDESFFDEPNSLKILQLVESLQKSRGF